MHYVVVRDRWLKYVTGFIPRQVSIVVMCPFCRYLAEVRYSLSNLVLFFFFLAQANKYSFPVVIETLHILRCQLWHQCVKLLIFLVLNIFRIKEQ